MGCQDIRVRGCLIDKPPLSVDEAVHTVKTYLLSRRALTQRRRGEHAVRYSDLSFVEETSRFPSPVLLKESYRAETPESSGTTTRSSSK